MNLKDLSSAVTVIHTMKAELYNKLKPGIPRYAAKKYSDQYKALEIIASQIEFILSNSISLSSRYTQRDEKGCAISVSKHSKSELLDRVATLEDILCCDNDFTKSS